MKKYFISSYYQIDRVVYEDVYTLRLIDMCFTLYFMPLL